MAGPTAWLGVGAAMIGLRPVVEIMTVNFVLLALDALVNMAAKIPFMSGDHRVVFGADAARFLAALAERLGRPSE